MTFLCYVLFNFMMLYSLTSSINFNALNIKSEFLVVFLSLTQMGAWWPEFVCFLFLSQWNPVEFVPSLHFLWLLFFIRKSLLSSSSAWPHLPYETKFLKVYFDIVPKFPELDLVFIILGLCHPWLLKLISSSIKWR